MDRFEIAVDAEVLDDLATRLDRVRWPREPKAAPWQFGTDLAYMREVVDHWRHRYDWRATERRLNQFTHYRTPIDGKRVHFILERGSGPNPLPLILTHGWPGSVVEFLEVIEPLAHPERHGGDVADAFTVVVPSLPGYGFSDPPEAPTSAAAIAASWSKLMTEALGFPRYVAQGGDWGGIVSAQIGLKYPSGLAALHLNIAALQPSPDPADPFTDEEIRWMAADAERRRELTGYRAIQSTRPHTLAYGLSDSPVGLAAWILEKFHDWTVRGSPKAPPFDLDHLITNVMLYWLDGSVAAANWLYVDLADGGARTVKPGERVEVPTGFLLCPADLGPPPPTRRLERCFNVAHRRDADAGGHFVAFERPALFVDEVRTFFRRFR